MKRNESKTVFAVIAAAAFALLAGCASVPSAQTANDDLFVDSMAEVRP